MTHLVALLRGINVGGNNLIRMADLKTCFETAGFANVATYIQSGNVLFEAPEKDDALIAGRIQDALAETFGYQSWVAIRSHHQMRTIVAGAPAGFGTEPEQYRYNVLFLRPTVTASDVIADIRTREGVDAVFAGTGVLYFSNLMARASQSYLSRLVALPVYKDLTIRNWNTTVKVLNLMDARSEQPR
jgi:uncharacterized protein (DUF1697 family)